MRRCGCTLLSLLIFGASLAPIPAIASDPNVETKHHHHKFFHAAEWAGAGVVAGQFAGPYGSAAVGTAHFRHDLAHRRTFARGMVKIFAPIAALTWTGQIGLAGYEAFDHQPPKQP